MKTRPDDRLQTVDQLFRDIVLGPVDWPNKRFRLNQTSHQAYLSRSSRPDISVAELYHESSKLHLSNISRMAASQLSPADVRQRFLKNRSTVFNQMENDDFLVDEVVGQSLHTVACECGHLFYAVEVWMANLEKLGVFDPVAVKCWLTKVLTGDEIERMIASLRLADDPGVGYQTHSIFLLVACFPRNEVLFGMRGYRRTLLEAGQLAQLISLQLGEYFAIWLSYDFHDRFLNEVLGLDGTESSVVAAIVANRRT